MLTSDVIADNLQRYPRVFIMHLGKRINAKECYLIRILFQTPCKHAYRDNISLLKTLLARHVRTLWQGVYRLVKYRSSSGIKKSPHGRSSVWLVRAASVSCNAGGVIRVKTIARKGAF